MEKKRGARSQICRFGGYKPGHSSVLHISVRYVRLSEGLKGLEPPNHPLKNRVGTIIFNIHFGGYLPPIFGLTPLWPGKNLPPKPGVTF